MIAIPGFEAVFAIAGLLAVAWYVHRNKDDEKDNKDNKDKKRT